MKYLWLLVLVTFCYSQSVLNGYYYRSKAAAPPAWTPSFTYDLWIDFELNADCTDDDLEATDHNANAQVYSVDNGTPVCHSDSAFKDGAYSYQANTEVEARMQLDNADVDSASVGFWFRSGLPSGGWGNRCYVAFGTGDPYVRVSPAGGGLKLQLEADTNSGTVAITINTWYWITMKAAKGSHIASMNVYDAAGAQVGSTVTCTIADVQVLNVKWGGWNWTTGSGNDFIDDLCIDFTDATFPLGNGQ